jgi:hypothetical protein
MDRTENTATNENFIVVGVFTYPLPRNWLHNTVLLMRACMLRALRSNGRCLQSRRLTRDLYTDLHLKVEE